jgi:hypothetical protein
MGSDIFIPRARQDKFLGGKSKIKLEQVFQTWILDKQ